MIISAFDIINALSCCDDGLKKCNVQVSYENDSTRNNAVIFVRDTVIMNSISQFFVNVRGYKNDGKSTVDIVGELIKYNGMYQDLMLGDTDYTVRFWFSNAFGAGADDIGRTIIGLDVQVQIYKKGRN